MNPQALARLRYAFFSVVLASVPIALMALASRTSGERGMAPEPLGNVIAFGSAQWYPWVLVAPIVDWQVRRWRPRGARDRVFLVAGHAIVLLAFTAVHSSVLLTATWLVFQEPRPSLGTSIVDGMIPDALVYGVLVAGFTIAESRRRHTEIAERLRAEVAEARLDALRQQLNPHFLFNTLNHIVAQLRSHDVQPALSTLLALSDLLRDVLRDRAQVIPLRDEVRMIERYLEIERARFGDRLVAQVTFEPRTLDALVPSLLLQPLLENAMRHGVSRADGRCTVSVVARGLDGRLLIEVRDAGPGLDDTPPRPAGIGLANTRQRLAYLYGSDHTFELQTLQGGGLLAAIDIPLRRS